MPELHIEPKRAPRDAKLGAHLGTRDPRAPLLAHHIMATAARPPGAVHRSDRYFDWPMLANDRVGDCVIAALMHGIQHMRLGAGTGAPPFTDQGALSLYSTLTGYNPADPSTDQGTDPNLAFRYWQDTGIPLPGGDTDRIAGFVQVQPADGLNLRRAIYEFDGAGLSIALPLSAQQQAIWDVVGDPSSDPDSRPGSWGGHEIWGVSYDRSRIAFYSWGQVMLMTWRFWGTYGDVALVPLSQDVLGKRGVSETGVDFATLSADLSQL